ncbi:hypothetical protein F5883DRAFT_160408 [Diaporthe sp. PMI_573]|nr:hypothetical protein F5883DRAFT_160408 [Diaporthaceae sp. PMI_573]
MLFKQALIVAFMAATTLADLHHIAYCRGEEYVWGNDIDAAATECACKAYKNRNQGTDWWNTCPDCTYDGTYCNSKMKHIGGDEVTYYCEKICHAKGAVTDKSV